MFNDTTAQNLHRLSGVGQCFKNDKTNVGLVSQNRNYTNDVVSMHIVQSMCETYRTYLESLCANYRKSVGVKSIDNLWAVSVKNDRKSL